MNLHSAPTWPRSSSWPHVVYRITVYALIAVACYLLTVRVLREVAPFEPTDIRHEERPVRAVGPAI